MTRHAVIDANLSRAIIRPCPPCTGDCNQGRDCPARASRRSLRLLYLIVAVAAALIIVAIIAAPIIKGALAEWQAGRS